MSEALSYIAVVDDEPSVCKAFGRLLRTAQFEVATFSSGAAFLASLSGRTPDGVVLDLQMPGMNGFDVLSNLAAQPKIKLAVVIVTADNSHDSSALQQRAIAGGAAAYLRKPVEAKQLLDTIRAAIAGKTP